MKRVMTAVLAVLLLASVSIGGALPVYAETAHMHTAYEEMGVGASLPEAIGPDFSGYEPHVPTLDALPVGTATEFLNMDPAKSYYLTGDITLTESYGTFTGNLYGMGHTITTSVPLFERIERSIITDLTIEGTVTGSESTGALANRAIAPELYRVINKADVTGTGVTAGFIGTIDKSDYSTVFSYCENHGDVSSASEAGGLFGYSQGSYGTKEGAKATSNLLVEHCLNTGTISTTKNQAGGLIGQIGGGGDGNSLQWFYLSELINCRNTGAVTGQDSGGLVGDVNTGHLVVKGCVNEGEIDATGISSGIVGIIHPRGDGQTVTMTDCYNKVAIHAGGDAAGILGRIATEAGNQNLNGCTLKIENCQNDGDVLSDTARPGGIFGATDRGHVKIDKVYVKNCTNNGRVQTKGNYAGGIAGRIDVSAVMMQMDGFYDAPVVYEGCVNNGEVETFKNQGGGMVGYVNNAVDSGENLSLMEFRSCVNNGHVFITDPNMDAAIGGMVGATEGHVSLYDCVNTGKLESGGCVGGMVGLARRVVKAYNCVSIADIVGGKFVGGIIGTNNNANKEYTDANDFNVTYPGHVIDGCVVKGTIKDRNCRDKKWYKAMGGVAGLLLGDATVTNCAVMVDITAVFDSDEENDCGVGGLIGHQAGAPVCNITNNYFAGTLNAGTQGFQFFLTNVRDGSKLSDSVIANNYTTVADLPLYSTNGSPSTDVGDVMTDAVGSDALANMLNTTAGAGAFVNVTSCEGVKLTIDKDAVAAYNMTRNHADAGHDYFTQQAYDDTHHWMACAVCGEADPATVTAHAAAAGEKATCQTRLQCASCGQAFGELDPLNHEDADIVWTSTPEDHSASTTCCGEIVMEGHTFENGACAECGYVCLHNAGATCKQGAACEMCGETYNGTAAHDYDTEKWVAVDAEDKHYHPCAVCGAPDPDSGVACTEAAFPADCLNRAICTACGQAFGDFDTTVHVDTHNFFYEPNAADTTKCEKHYACCGALAELVDHEAKAPATCCVQSVCKNCELRYGELDPTNHENPILKYTVNAEDPTKHDKTYECCNLTETEEHKGGTANCIQAAECELCKAVYGAINDAHVFDHQCDTDCNLCGTLRSTAGHAFGGWLVEEEPTETEAGYQMRACVVCGAVQKATIAPITNPDSALGTTTEPADISDAWIGVVVIAVAGVLVVGAIVALIVNKTNKRKGK